MRPMIVSFATNEEHYRLPLDGLRRRARELGHASVCECLPRWAEGKNPITRYKPTFIRRQLKTWQCPLLWLDADTVLQAPIEVGPTGSGVGLAVNPFGSADSLPWTAAAILVRPGVEAWRFLRHWERRCLDDRDAFGDHYRLADARALLERHQDIAPHLAGRIILRGGNGRVPKELGVA